MDVLYCFCDSVSARNLCGKCSIIQKRRMKQSRWLCDSVSARNLCGKCSANETIAQKRRTSFPGKRISLFVRRRTYSLIYKWFAVWHVLQMLHRGAIAVGYPRGTAKMVAMVEVERNRNGIGTTLLTTDYQ